MRKIIKPKDFNNDKKVVKIPDIEFEFPPMPEPDDGEFMEMTSFPDGTAAVEAGKVISGIPTDGMQEDTPNGEMKAMGDGNDIIPDISAGGTGLPTDDTGTQGIPTDDGTAAAKAPDASVGAAGGTPQAAVKPHVQKQRVKSAAEDPELIEKLKKEITAKLKKELVGELSRKKIRAQRECDKLLMEAKQQADEMLAAAQVQKDNILNDAVSQATKIKADAFNEGSKKGFEEKKQLLDNLAIYISNSIEEIKKERNQFFIDYEKELKHLSVDICEKVIAQKVEEDDMVMYGVIKDAVRYVRDTKWVKAEVSAQLSGYLDSLEQELKNSGQNVEFIFAEGVPKDTCLMNTSEGLVVATVSEQIKNLRNFIDSLDKVGQDEDRS